MKRLTEKRDGQNVIPLRQDGKTKWALCSAGMGDASTQWLYGEAADILADYQSTGLAPSDIADLRNELCLKCGRYKTAHEGSCDGCRWKEK